MAITDTDDHRILGAVVDLIRDQRSFDSVDGPDAFTIFTTFAPGTAVAIVGRESHGNNPWTRWTGEVVDLTGAPGRRLYGLVEGLDF